MACVGSTRGSSVSRSGSTSAKTGRAPGHHDRQRGVGGRQRRRDDLRPRRRCRARAESARSHRCRCRRRRRGGAPDAAANSVSNASTSGPSTNHARSITRSIAARTAADSSARCRSDERDSQRVMRRRRLPRSSRRSRRHARGSTRASARSPSRSGTRGSQPTRLTEPRRVGVEAADVDRLLFRGPGHVTHGPGAGDVDQQRRRDRGATIGSRPPTLKTWPLHGVRRAGAQERVGRIVDVDEVAHLRAVAVDLDLAVLEREADEPADEALAIVLDAAAAARRRWSAAASRRARLNTLL